MARVKADASAVIERHGGTVNQFVGDEIMALFGIPVARRDDARRAVAAALELHAAVDAYLATLEPAFARTPGDAHRHRHRPGRGATQRRPRRRLRAHRRHRQHGRPPARRWPRPREVVVSARAGTRCPTPSTPKPTAPLELKGKEQPLVAYRIRGARKAPAGDASALVGRDEELRDFRALAEACAAAPPQPRRRSFAATRASASRASSPSSSRSARDARLLVPWRAGARLRRRDRARRGAQPRAQPARRRRRRRRGRRDERRSSVRARHGRWPPSSFFSCTTCSTSRRRPTCARSPRR